MAVRDIVTSENPLLRKKSKRIRDFSPALQQLVDDMFDTMHATNGLGLAAPQIGVLQRVFVVELPAELDEEGEVMQPAERYVLVNPEIIRRHGEQEMIEGCLSVPGFRGLVRRSTQVIIKGQDLKGHGLRYRAQRLLAQAFQHELDHLDGILYTDRIESADKLWRITPDMDEEIGAV
ncbi:MAG: peptide deformylase [Anaerolineae bacterium]